MPQTSRNILIALSVSLAAHVGGLGLATGYYHYFVRPGQTGESDHSELTIAIDPELKSIDPEQEMGDPSGKGIGSNASPGERPMLARESDADQALLSRDPVGVGRIGAPPTSYVGPSGENGVGGAPAAITPDAPPLKAQTAAWAAAMPAPVVPPKMTAPAQVAPDAALNAKIPLTDVQPSPKMPQLAMSQPQKAVPAAVQAARAAAAAPAQRPGDMRKPGQPQRSADPLPPSESDSDPFSRLSGSVVFRDGKLEVRLGRKVKTTRPQLLIAGQIDLATLHDPTVVLEVHIAPTGKVTDVSVTHSSGSNNVDEPTRVAVYDWWFQPALDRTGKAVADVVFFDVEYR